MPRRAGWRTSAAGRPTVRPRWLAHEERGFALLAVILDVAPGGGGHRARLSMRLEASMVRVTTALARNLAEAGSSSDPEI